MRLRKVQRPCPGNIPAPPFLGRLGTHTLGPAHSKASPFCPRPLLAPWPQAILLSCQRLCKTCFCVGLWRKHYQRPCIPAHQLAQLRMAAHAVIRQGFKGWRPGSLAARWFEWLVQPLAPPRRRRLQSATLVAEGVSKTRHPFAGNSQPRAASEGAALKGQLACLQRRCRLELMGADMDARARWAKGAIDGGVDARRPYANGQCLSRGGGGTLSAAGCVCVCVCMR